MNKKNKYNQLTSESDHLVIAASESEAENKKKTEPVVDKDKKSKRKETKILDVSPISTRAKRGMFVGYC